tara:strand:- start:1895 stop:2743 length:849 start_codon:yes stop_codon:yes gene_type:complete
MKLSKDYKMPSTKAFAPGNISCIFKIFNHIDPRWKGSYGLGFTINKGVTSEINKSNKDNHEIYFNNKLIKFPTVEYIINNLSNEYLTVNLISNLPLGCGFGISGASTLATAYALNKLLKLNKSNIELAIQAHISEVINNTGLGDVTNQFFGGFCLKQKPSSNFIVDKLPLSNIKVYCKYFSKINTEDIISKKNITKLNSAADLSLKKINLNKNNFKKLLNISKEFSINSNLLNDNKVIETIKEIEKNNGNASMIMLGNVVFSDSQFKDSEEYTISDQGAKLL